MLTWSVASALLLSMNLVWNKEGHIGEASPIFIAVLLSVNFCLGATYGATIWAIQSIFVSKRNRSRASASESRHKLLRLLFIGALGYLALISFNGPTLSRNCLNLLFAIPLSFAATVLPEIKVKRRRVVSAKDLNTQHQAGE